MRNQTIEQKDIIDKGTDFKAVPGYQLAIFRKGEYQKILSENTTFKPPLLDKKSYRAIAVISSNTPREMTFMSYKAHTDNYHSFQIEFFIQYKIASPEILANKYKIDPITALRDHISNLIGGQLVKIQWEELMGTRANPEQFRKSILNKRIANIQNDEKPISHSIMAYAGSYGIELENIDFKFIPPKDITSEDQTREQVKREMAKANLQHQKNTQIKIHEAELKAMGVKSDSIHLLESLYEAVNDAVRNIGANIDNPDKFLKAVKAGMQAQIIVRNGITGIDAGGNANPANALEGGQPNLLLGSGQNGEISMELLSFFADLKEADAEKEKKRKFLAKYLHLLSATMDQDESLCDDLIAEIMEIDLPDKVNGLVSEAHKLVDEFEQFL